jgi:hypothetical protein
VAVGREFTEPEQHVCLVVSYDEVPQQARVLFSF